MTNTLTWLHLSDLHLRADTAYDANIVLPKLLEYLANELPALFRNIDFVFFTGDTAYYGRRDDYAQAVRFFDELLATVKLQKDRLFIVPGNHDIDRGRIGEPAKALSEHITAPRLSIEEMRSRVGGIFADSSARQMILERQKEFHEFVTAYLSQDLKWADNYRYFSTLIPFGPIEIAIYGLNSALLCASDNDNGRLLLGERQVRAATEIGQGKQLRIGLMHHPTEWLHQLDRADCEPLLRNSCDFLLHGHLHEQAFRQDKRQRSSMYVFASGAGFDKRTLPNSCNVVHLDLSTGKGQALGLSYSDKGGGFWTVDLTSDPELKDGLFDIDLGRPYIVHREPPTNLPHAITDSPADYVSYVKASGQLPHSLSDDLVKIATLSPKDAVDLLEHLGRNSTSFAVETLAAIAGRLEPQLAQSPADLIRYTKLFRTLARPDSEAFRLDVDAEFGLLALGPNSQKLSKEVAFELPRNTHPVIRYAQALTFTLYVENHGTDPIVSRRLTMTFSAPFFRYAYQSSPIQIEPFDRWDTTQVATESVRCVYSPAGDELAIVEPGSSRAIGTVTMLVPRGEADGGPISIEVPYKLQVASGNLVAGQLHVILWPATTIEDARIHGRVLEVQARERHGVASGFVVQKGQLMSFAATGVVSLDSGVNLVNPDGLLCDSAGNARQPAPNAFTMYEMTGQLLPHAPAGALVAWIGEWSEQSAFLVGSSNTIVAEATGPLHLGVNDLFKAYGDNTGAYTVGIRVR